jgi:hypothetical protein
MSELLGLLRSVLKELFIEHEENLTLFRRDLREFHDTLDSVEDRLEEIEQLLPHPNPTRLAFELPTRTKNGQIMANFELPNDEILTITMKATNSAGAFEPIPSGDVFTVVSSDPASLNAVMGTDAAGNVAVVVNALKQAASNVTVTVTDSAGLTAATQIFDIVTDATPTALALDLVDATHVPQPVPAS